ncbi:hypothetical protein [Jiangella anatolica]|uniref:Gfo/Idh/MocA-like oxidoreductase N-terminal domain-containing protein n=1 Tax=Jiangella anatolica TaxID=2670374 RepID=A0A2W2BKQ3_9ACTN|nr:hypothetical protein [Jiangella anatolica]PZF85860.1 hypothetical protein C1I92_02970 [Jiangella anatolica]
MSARRLTARLVGLTEQHPYTAAVRAHAGFELTNSDDADVVVLAVPLADRPAAVEQTVKAGKHTVVHGVLAEDPDQAAELAALAQNQGTVCLPDYHVRFQPAVRAARAAVAAGRVGLPWNVQGDLISSDTAAKPASLAVHAIDTVRALTGLPVRTVRRTDAGSVLLLLLTHDHGVTSTLAVGHAPGAATHRYRISGSHGMLDVDASKPAWAGGASMAGLLTELHTAVVTDRPAELSLDDAVAAQRVLTDVRTAEGSTA